MPGLFWRLSGLYSHLQNRTFSVYWQARSPGVLDGLLPGSDDRVLEVGCGVGLWTSYLAPRVRSIVGLDLDRASLRAARLWKSASGAAPTAQVPFLEASAECLPFPSASFDKVLAADVIEHVPDHAAAIREFARVVKPSGRVVVTTLLADRPSYVSRMTFDDHVREYSPASLLHLFDGTGLRPNRVFFFYRAPSLLARELQVAASQRAIGRLPVVDLAIGAICRLIAGSERILPIGRPAGIGVVAVKTP